jgi:uncharacterized protein
MSNDFFWRKIKKSDFPHVESLLKDNENNYVNASARFIAQEANTIIWVLCGKDKEIQALLIIFKSNIIPVLCGIKIPALDIKKGKFLPSKKIHSVQGLKDEVIVIEGELEKNGWKAKEIIDYELMSLDAPPNRGKNISGFSNIVLRKPVMTDIDGMAPLQAGYEKEEVLPTGSTFSPSASRLNLSNIIAKGQVLAAEIDGRLIGKINVSGVSFTRYQIGGVYVLPEFRGKGIGSLMAYEFISPLISEGRGVTLFVRKTNTSARRLYSNLGFTVINDYRISYY